MIYRKCLVVEKGHDQCVSLFARIPPLVLYEATNFVLKASNSNKKLARFIVREQNGVRILYRSKWRFVGEMKMSKVFFRLTTRLRLGIITWHSPWIGQDQSSHGTSRNQKEARRRLSWTTPPASRSVYSGRGAIRSQWSSDSPFQSLWRWHGTHARAAGRLQCARIGSCHAAVCTRYAGRMPVLVVDGTKPAHHCSLDCHSNTPRRRLGRTNHPRPSPRRQGQCHCHTAGLWPRLHLYRGICRRCGAQ
jgi:hypothetical protein